MKYGVEVRYSLHIGNQSQVGQIHRSKKFEILKYKWMSKINQTDEWKKSQYIKLQIWNLGLKPMKKHPIKRSYITIWFTSSYWLS